MGKVIDLTQYRITKQFGSAARQAVADKIVEDMAVCDICGVFVDNIEQELCDRCLGEDEHSHRRF